MAELAAEWAEGRWAVRTFTVEEVRAVFQSLEARAVAAGVGDECLLVIQQVAEEVLGNLSAGEEEDGEEEDGEDGPRERALGALTEAEFDQAAWELFGSPSFDGVSDIEAVRQSLVPAWRPSPRSNAAMIEALAVYRLKRRKARGWGEAPAAARAFAKREAMSAYNRVIRG